MAPTSRSSILLAVTFAILALAAPAIAQTPRSQIASLKRQLAAAKRTNSRLETKNAKLSGLSYAPTLTLTTRSRPSSR